jgi:glutaminyl-tRNA synthetase
MLRFLKLVLLIGAEGLTKARTIQSEFNEYLSFSYMSAPHKPAAAALPVTHFLTNIIEQDLKTGTYAQRQWGGSPGDAAHHAAGGQDIAKIRTRFPPEPNGHPHIGHAKSILLNFGLAKRYGGVCHMRFDDTNPETEDQAFVDGILNALRWLGVSWTANGTEHLFHASDYFAFMFRAAEYLIGAGLAYVDEQSPEQIRETRGTLKEPGRASPWRDRSADESLRIFREMRDGKHADGSMVLRAKVDMAAPNINLRDPVIYRIRHAEHHRTGKAWCVYPMYSYAHPIEDALEQITHSICTLEFEDQRPWYDWLLARLIEGGLLASPAPHQYEFARLNLTYIVTSKRKLKQLVNEGHVKGWDDPRMPTVIGLRRRGYTAEAISLLCERTGASKSDSWIDYSVLEHSLREVLDPVAPRAMAVIDPIKLIITNFSEGEATACSAPMHPSNEAAGTRSFVFTRELWIEREDFEATPPAGFHRLFVGNTVRLRYGYVVKCTGFKADENGRVSEVHAEYFPESKSGTPTSGQFKTKGVITWLSTQDALPAEIRVFDRLFIEPHPDAGGRDFLSVINPSSLVVHQGFVEKVCAAAAPEQHYQFERHGYFVADQHDSKTGALVFNRAVSLKDSWTAKP